MFEAGQRAYFRNMLVPLSELKPMQCGIIERVNRPEMVLALIEMGCGIGERVEVAHTTPGRGPMAIFSCGRKLALRRDAANELLVRLSDSEAMDGVESMPSPVQRVS